MLWPTVVILAFLALGCGLIEAVLGWFTPKHAVPPPTPPTPPAAPIAERGNEQQRALLYLRVAIAWHSYLRAVRTLLYPEEGPPNESRDLASVLQARAQLQAIGSPPVRELHDQALDSAVALIDLLRSQTMSPPLDRANVETNRMVLRAAFNAISERIAALELQMVRELSHQAQTRENVEITGRRVSPRGLALPTGQRRGEPRVSSPR
jgi:hypothetical protein